MEESGHHEETDDERGGQGRESNRGEAVMGGGKSDRDEETARWSFISTTPDLVIGWEGAQTGKGEWGEEVTGARK